jgi:hypothetical protein
MITTRKIPKVFPIEKFMKTVLKEIDDCMQTDYEVFTVLFPNEYELAKFLNCKFKSKHVIIIFTDHFNVMHTSNVDIAQANELKILDQLAYNNPTITFMYLGSFVHLKNNNMQVNWLNRPNAHFVNFNHFMDQTEFKQMDPVIEKNLDSTRIGISLSRQIRQHRLVQISLMYGLNLDKYCYISAMHLKKQLVKLSSSDFMDHCDWQFDVEHYELRNLMIEGFSRLYNMRNEPEINGPADDIYDIQNNLILEFTNIKNYQNNLRSLYKNSFVEFVSSTLFLEQTIAMNEKFTNCIGGFNFPIFISSVGTVEHVRNLGFDVFDDIVDHSYDLILDPIHRLHTAIHTNQHLLITHENTKKLWSQSQHRFQNNFDFLQNKLNDLLLLSLKNHCKEIFNLL